MRYTTSCRQLVEDCAGRNTSERPLDGNRLAQIYVALIALYPGQDIPRDVVCSWVGYSEAWLRI